MTLLDRQHDANATQPMDAPVEAQHTPHRHSGPLDRTGAGHVANTCGTHRPYQGMPTRVLYVASEAWSTAQKLLQPKARRKFEMHCSIPHPTDGHEVITVVGIINARSETCLMLFCGDTIEVTMDAKRGLATLWNAMKARWPLAAEALWQFEDFPHWYAQKWVAAWEAIQIQARRRTGDLS